MGTSQFLAQAESAVISTRLQSGVDGMTGAKPRLGQGEAAHATVSGAENFRRQWLEIAGGRANLTGRHARSTVAEMKNTSENYRKPLETSLYPTIRSLWTVCPKEKANGKCTFIIETAYLSKAEDFFRDKAAIVRREQVDSSTTILEFDEDLTYEELQKLVAVFLHSIGK